MSIKQDITIPRTATDLERKYKFKGTLAEVLGLIDETRDLVDAVESSLRSESEEHITALARDTEKIIMSALSTYVSKEEYAEIERKISAEFQIMSDQIIMQFSNVRDEIKRVDDELQSSHSDLNNYIHFSVEGITLGSSAENAITLTIENATEENDYQPCIAFKKGGQMFGWWDGENFHAGNIVVKVNERAQFGNFAFVPRSNGNLSFLKVGG